MRKLKELLIQHREAAAYVAAGILIPPGSITPYTLS